MQIVSPRQGPPRRRGLTRAGAPALPAALVALACCAVALACCAATAAAAPAGTQVVSWGEPGSGHLANDGISFPPTGVIGIDGLTATGAAAGPQQTFVVTSDAVFAAGAATDGALGLGDGNPSGSTTLVPIPGTAAASAVAAGGDAALVLEDDGTLLSFGRNQHLTAGIDNRVGGAGNGLPVWDPTPIPGLSGVRAVSAGLRSAFALKQDGTVWAWGDGETLGSLAAVSAGDSAVPQQVRLPSGRSATAIVAGYQDGYALLDDGSVVGWGVNEYGELGDGTSAPRPDPVPVSGLPTGGGAQVVSIAAGRGTAFALLDDGSFLAWGANDGGQLGLGNGAADVTTPTAPNPARAGGFPDYPRFTQLVAGSVATYGIAEDGRAYAWGYDDAGQLGGPVTSSFPYPAGTESPARHAEIPQRVGTLKDVPWLAGGSTANHQLALTTLTLQATIDSATRFFSQQLGTIGATRTTSVGAVGDPATVRRIRLVGPDARDFLIVGTASAAFGLDPALPLALSAGGLPLGVDVRFAPSGLGERHATLSVEADSEILRVPLDGFGVALTGGPQGEAGTPGQPGAPGAPGAPSPAGPAARDGASGRNGANGRNGRNGRDGVVKLLVRGATVRLERGKASALRVTVRNGTRGSLPRASVSLGLPRALGAGPAARGVVLKPLAAGAQRSVSLPIRVRADAVPGRYRVTVRLALGSRRLTRAVTVRVVQGT